MSKISRKTNGRIRTTYTADIEIIKLSDNEYKLYLVYLKKYFWKCYKRRRDYTNDQSFEKKPNIISRYAKHNNQNHKHNR